MTANKLKVILVTMDEPYYIPEYIDNILCEIGKDIEVLKLYALPPNLSKKSFLGTVRDFLDYFGILVFSYMVLLQIFYKACDLLNEHFRTGLHVHSVRLVCRKFGVPFSRIANINAEEVLAEMEGLGPDVIFSVAAPQILGKKIISVPTRCCLNIHSSLLPKYRGLNANFWVLAKGEKVTGVTIHYINQGIDDGDILLQKKIEIEPGWSLNDLYHRVMEAGSKAIAECLVLVYQNRVVTHKNEISEGSYFSFPAGKDVKEFRAKNRRFYKYY